MDLEELVWYALTEPVSSLEEAARAWEPAAAAAAAELSSLPAAP